MGQIRKLKNANDFFETVVRPNFEDHFGNNGDLRTAVNLAISLFSMRDWLLESHKMEIVEQFGEINKTFDFQIMVEDECPSFALIRDIANASKHMSLAKDRKRTDMTEAAEIKPRGFGEGPFGGGNFGTADIIIHLPTGGAFFDEKAREVFKYWEQLLEKLPS